MIKLSLFVLLVVLSWVDYDTTRIMLEQDGFDTESNPLLLWVINSTGSIVSIVYIKIVALTLCAFVWRYMKLWHITVVVGIYTITCLTSINSIYERYEIMNNNILPGETVLVFHRSDNNRIIADKKPHTDKVGKVYSDGTIETLYSREVWNVKRVDGTLQTTGWQRR